MNIRFLITAAVAAISISVFAQKPPAGGAGHPGAPGEHAQGMHRGMPEELKKQLNITPAQEKQLKAIRDKYQAKMPKFTPGQMPTEAERAKYKPVRDAMRKEMEAVYTQKQKDIMKKWHAAHPRPPMGGPGPGGPPGGKGGGAHGGGH